MDGARGRLRIALGAIGVLALGAGTGLVLTPDGGSAPPSAAAFDLEPLGAPDPTSLDDGLGHHLVRVPADRATSAPASVPGPVAAGPETSDASAVVRDLAALAGRVQHLERDPSGATVAVLDDGSRTIVGDGAPLDASPEAVLQAHPSVAAVEPVGGDWYAVTTTDDDGFAAATADLGLEAVPDVAFTSASDDPHSAQLWGLENPGDVSFGGVLGVLDIDADGVEARAAEQGAGVVVAVIDSGADPDHEDLPDFWVNTDEQCGNGIDDDANGYVDDCHGWDFYNGDNTPFDPGVDNSHGTHVAGTIAAVPDNGVGVAGLAPGVTVMNIKALQHGSAWMSALAGAIRYAVDNGATVINASWGSNGAGRSAVGPMADAVEYARSRGVVVVAAAGNSGQDIGVAPTFPASFEHDNVITVGADRADGAPAGFSNRGAEEVDLHAPGHYIVSTVPGGYAAKQGTSMAAPHVTAAVALVQASGTATDVAGVRRAILDTVDARVGLVGLSVTGGSLNAARAIGAEATTDAPPFEVTTLGLDSLAAGRTGRVQVRTTVRDTAMAGSRPVVVRTTVLTAIDGQAYGLVGLPVIVDGAARTTDDHAQVVLTTARPAGDARFLAGLTSTVELELDAGVYGFVTELVDADDPDAAYGPAAVSFARVADATPERDPGVDPAPDPTDPPGGATDPAPSGPDPSGPRPSGPQPSGPEPSGPQPTVPGTTPAPGPTAPTAPDTTPPPSGPTPTAPPTTPPAPPASPPPAPSGAPVLPGTPTPTTTPTPTPPTPTPSPTPAPSAPTPTAPPATVPVPTTSPPPTVTVPPVSRAGITIVKVTPSWGRPRGGGSVVIHGGDFPDGALVFFGPFPVRVKNVTGTSIVVEQPALLPGLYDVAVVDPAGRVAVLRRSRTGRL